ncbi:MAG: helix-turn-helix transcriptional regulator, partial [Candidatus Thorarchaeota archaeon]
MSDPEGSTEFNQFLGRTTSTLLILSLLEQDHEHSAYSLIKKIKKLSQGKLSIRAGTIYPQFEKLTRDGLILRHIRDIPSRSTGAVRQKSVYS